MFRYVYYIECTKTSTTCRYGEQNYFSILSDAEDVKENIKKVLTEMKIHWYWDSDVVSFKITRHLISKHFDWGQKVIFYWKNPKFY